MLRKLSKTVSRQNRAVCENDITTEEIRKTISTFENNKSPGNDGLTGDFHKTFTEVLMNDLQELYREISNLEEMPDSMPQAVITCIY